MRRSPTAAEFRAATAPVQFTGSFSWPCSFNDPIAGGESYVNRIGCRSFSRLDALPASVRLQRKT
jgi:hypothetical protein